MHRTLAFLRYVDTCEIIVELRWLLLLACSPIIKLKQLAGSYGNKEKRRGRATCLISHINDAYLV